MCGWFSAHYHHLTIDSLDELKYVKEYFADRFEIMLAETGFPSRKQPRHMKELSGAPFEVNPLGQREFMTKVVNWVRGRGRDIVTGVFWRPAYEPDMDKDIYYVGPLFNRKFEPLPVLHCAFKNEPSDYCDTQ